MIGKTKLFISSYSYRWAMGCRQYRPLNPMPIKEFLAKAKGHGLDGVQIVDNVNPENFTKKECKEIFAVAQKLGIELQWGFEGWEENKIDRLLEICSKTEAKLLRGVFGKNFFQDMISQQKRIKKAISKLSELLPKLEKRRIILAIENHFDLKIFELMEVIKKVNHPLVKICLDTTNALAEIEKPLNTVKALGPFSTSMHFKDFAISKVVGGYTIMGRPIGEGQQGCQEILRKALEINPNIEVCIELSIIKPEDASTMLEQEESWVKNSVKNTKEYLNNIYSDFIGNRDKKSGNLYHS